MNLPTILILALIGIALFAALRSMKKHPSGCSGHCSGCLTHVSAISSARSAAAAVAMSSLCSSVKSSSIAG